MASATPGTPVESRNFLRSPHLSGFDLLEARASSASWQIYNVQHGIAIPGTWAARVNHNGRQIDLSAGRVHLVRPGEFHSTTGAARVGDLSALIISDEALQQYAGDYLTRPTAFNWKQAHLPCSAKLANAYRQVVEALHSAPTAMQAQSTMVELFSVVMSELVADSHAPEGSGNDSQRAARMRELMHDSPEGLTVSLSELADAVHLTRFQALRAFKQKYGVPPHAYQLAVRVGMALPLLAGGQSITEVAHGLGFADQSHFARHFKRVLWLTPGHYARGARRTPLVRRPTCVTRSDGTVFST
jgi:AraC-like DNA-binding protein